MIFSLSLVYAPESQALSSVLWFSVFPGVNGAAALFTLRLPAICPAPNHFPQFSCLPLTSALSEPQKPKTTHFFSVEQPPPTDAVSARFRKGEMNLLGVFYGCVFVPLY